MPIFVVHEHHAKRAGLHYDLRLEMDGVLKSWAFRKELPVEKGVKRLGIQQEDHDLDYASFEGEITEGYGAGKVLIWDRGDYEILEYVPNEKLVCILKGSRLNGKYVLLKTKMGWLLFKA
ncbi:MAG: 3'-phosphoesterase [Candidatus Terraquivivens tikiterensis]|uniref:3'-phosphoesterase n=1 Tax=Candidatus Terraquivivens tikiterensis TaxID=1980982 RepID=A0A2R7Y9L8_9ARCH|nr:MAG: 3'-phosphoesterase [Candidatus Terraquivivens tikiterensis]